MTWRDKTEHQTEEYGERERAREGEKGTKELSRLLVYSTVVPRQLFRTVAGKRWVGGVPCFEAPESELPGYDTPKKAPKATICKYHSTRKTKDRVGIHARFPIPDTRFPISDTRFPTTDFRQPISDNRFPISESWAARRGGQGIPKRSLQLRTEYSKVRRAL